MKMPQKKLVIAIFFSYLNILIAGQIINYTGQEQSRPPYVDSKQLHFWFSEFLVILVVYNI